MRPIPYIPLGGTFEPDGHEWRHRGSLFDQLARQYAIIRCELDDDPTQRDESVWSRGLNGLAIQKLWGGYDDDWIEGVERVNDTFARECEQCNADGTGINPGAAVHSHAGNVTFRWLADPRSLAHPPSFVLSLDMPVRRDHREFYLRARELHPELPIVHIRSTGFGWHSRYRILGKGLWRGGIFFSSKLGIANVQLKASGGHSRFLRVPKHMTVLDSAWTVTRAAVLMRFADRVRA